MKVEAIVYKKNGKPRKGKGFSRKELEEAGITIKEALKLGIPVDRRRSSALSLIHISEPTRPY